MRLDTPAKEVIQALLGADNPDTTVHWNTVRPSGPGRRVGQSLRLIHAEKTTTLWVKRVNHPTPRLVDALREMDARDPQFRFHPRVWAYEPDRGLLVTGYSPGTPLRGRFIRALLTRRADDLVVSLAHTIAGYHRAAEHPNGRVRPHNDLTIRNILVEPDGTLRIIDFDALVHPAFPPSLPPHRDVAVMAVNIAITAARTPTVTDAYGAHLTKLLIDTWSDALGHGCATEAVNHQIQALIRGVFDRPLAQIYTSRLAQRWLGRQSTTPTNHHDQRQ